MKGKREAGLWSEVRKPFVTPASSDPDSGQDVTLTPKNLLDYLRRLGGGVVFAPQTNGKALPLSQHSPASRG